MRHLAWNLNPDRGATYRGFPTIYAGFNGNLQLLQTPMFG